MIEPTPATLAEQGARVAVGLRSRLLLMTVAFVLFAELLIFPPSAATQRNRWLEQRVQAAEIAAVALEASPDRELSKELSQRLMNETGMLALAIGQEDMRELIFAPANPPTMDIKTFDLRDSNWRRDIWQTFGHMFAPEGRFIRILGRPSMMDGDNVVSMDASLCRGDHAGRRAQKRTLALHNKHSVPVFADFRTYRRAGHILSSTDCLCVRCCA